MGGGGHIRRAALIQYLKPKRGANSKGGAYLKLGANPSIYVLPFLCSAYVLTVLRTKDEIFQLVTQAYSEKEIPSAPNRSRTYDLPISTSDALPLSYRRLVVARTFDCKYGESGTSCKILYFILFYFT